MKKILEFVSTPSNQMILNYLLEAVLLENLVAYATRIIKDEEIARDVVMTKIFKFLASEDKLNEFIEKGKVKPEDLRKYLFLIVINAAKDEYRRKKIEFIQLDDDNDVSKIEDDKENDSNLDFYIKKLKSISLKAKLNNNEEKLLYLLVKMCSNKEMAKKLEITKKELANRKYRLIIKLKKLATESG